MPVAIVCGEDTRSEDDPKAEADEDGKTPQIEITTPRVINDTPPIWTKAPKDLEQKDYTDFYRTLYPMNFEEPLFQIHLNVDFPFNLTGVLYFPRLKPNMEIQRDKIHLYSQQVFITDNVENIVPDFLTLLHGVIDSPDIPLNVSRSYLQEDGNVKKITSHISKKVSDKLGQMFKKDRPDFEAKWNDIKMFIEYGMMMDEKFFDRASKFSLYTDTSGTKRTMEELLAAVAETHIDKDGNTVLLYANDLQAQHSYIQAAEAEGYTVLIIDSPLVSHLVQKLEMSGEKMQMRRVDADIVSRLIPKDDALEAMLDAELQKGMSVEFAKLMPSGADAGTFKVAFASMSPSAAPVVLTQGEFMRRMKDQQRFGGGGGMAMMGNLPDSYDVVFNANHPMILGWSEQKPAEREAAVRRAIDLARLSQGLLMGEELTRFISKGFDSLAPLAKKKPVAKKKSSTPKAAKK
jgi:molecular chaperone HtpG